MATDPFAGYTILKDVSVLLLGGLVAAIATHFLTLLRFDREYRLRRLDELFQQHDKHATMVKDALDLASNGCFVQEQDWKKWKVQISLRVTALREGAGLLAGVKGAIFILFENLEPAFKDYFLVQFNVANELEAIADCFDPCEEEVTLSLAIDKPRNRAVESQRVFLESTRDHCIRILEELRRTDDTMKAQMREEAVAIRRGGWRSVHFNR